MKPARSYTPGQPRLTCRVCGTVIRRTARSNLEERLCHEHDVRRREQKSAFQRRARSGTTAPPVALTPGEAHWLCDAWEKVKRAENPLLRRTTADAEVTALLDALNELHDELDSALGPVHETLQRYKWDKPAKGWSPRGKRSRP